VESTSQEGEQLQRAIADLVAAIRANRSGEEESKALIALVSQLRVANQNLVLASVRAQILQEQAEERNRQQNEFLAMLAHELRNPMAPIGNAANLLAKLSSAHPLLPQIQGVISRQVEHMSRLIHDLLDASRITSGKIALQKSRITVNDLINHSLEIVRPSIEQKRQQLKVEPLAEAVWMEGDLMRLSQALSNLLVNASKYTPEGGQILLAVRQEAGAIRLVLTDNGAGIEPELLPHIFDLFRQGSRTLARSEGGLGVGLSIAKGLIEMHGGKILARSAGAGMGSQFDILLPVLKKGSDESPVSSPALLQHARTSQRILLIEDNADTNETLQMLLELDGHRTASARDGLTGVSMAMNEDYDVVVCDIGLPGLDGYAVIEQIRQRANHRQPFVIALSGYGQPEDRERALKAGFDEHIVKPVTGEYLLHLIGSR
jgi:signal transduction histidine kinase